MLQKKLIDIVGRRKPSHYFFGTLTWKVVKLAMMLTTLTARYLHTPQGTLDYPVIVIDEAGVIASIHSDPTNKAEGTLTSTFFDIHNHGAANHDVMHASPAELSVVNRFLATKGVGQYLPTTVTAPIDQTLKSLEGLANAIETHTARNEARPMGIHLEGPFISHAKRGVHPPADILPPDIAIFDRFHEAARGHIRLITIAPEIPGALALIEHATALGVKSEPWPQQCDDRRSGSRDQSRRSQRHTHLQRHAHARSSRPGNTGRCAG